MSKEECVTGIQMREAMNSTMPHQTHVNTLPVKGSTEAEVGGWMTEAVAKLPLLNAAGAREEQSDVHERKDSATEAAGEMTARGEHPDVREREDSAAEVAGEVAVEEKRREEPGEAEREARKKVREVERPEDEVRPLRVEERLLDGGTRGEKVAELLRRRCDLRNLGLALSWMIFEGGRSQLGRSWLWGKVAAMKECLWSGQLLGNRSLFPFPHMWKRLETKLRGTLIEDIFMDSFLQFFGP